MRIISDFHDYYDSVQAAGQDQTLVYFRARREVELDSATYPFPFFRGWSTFYHRRTQGATVAQHIVGFCGRIFPVLALSPSSRLATDSGAVFCHTLADVDSWIETHCRKREIQAYLSKPRRWRLADDAWPRGQRRENFAEFFAVCAAKQSAFGSLFVDSRCPIFVASVSWVANTHGLSTFKIVYNACLKELQFFRVIDTFTAFQELQMFLGAMAQPNKPIPNVSDKDMVSIKGFDEWSFRKPPASHG